MQRHMSNFKPMARAIFGPYQASCMAKSERHALNHLVEALRQVGSIEYLVTEGIKRSHRHFEKCHKLTSRKMYRADAYSLANETEESIKNDLSGRGMNEPCRNFSIIRSDKGAQTCLVHSEKTITIIQL